MLVCYKVWGDSADNVTLGTDAPIARAAVFVNLLLYLALARHVL